MPFFNREKDIKQMKAILSGEPNLVYFVYGPINSGKTALLMKVFEELPENYRIFYINFRARDVESMEDLIRVMFRVKEKEKNLSEFLKKVLKAGAKFLETIGGIPISKDVFEILFKKSEKVDDVFAFLEEYFKGVVNLNYRPVLVFDEMQTIRDIMNTRGKSVIARLFNFLVRLTKELHICHCLCATSDCLFIDDIYSNARLEGRAKYILVDDLEKKEAFQVYVSFGFSEKELIWEYIGGKFGDMIRLYEDKKRGLAEKEALNEMFRDERARLRWTIRKIEEGEKKAPPVKEIKEVFKLFKEKEIIEEEKIKGKVLRFLIEENILFYNPLTGTVQPQGRLIWKAIKEII